MAAVSRRQLSVHESASPRPRTPLYDNTDTHFLPIQQHQQQYNLQGNTPELYQVKEMPQSHSAFASTPRVNLNLQNVQTRQGALFANTTRNHSNAARQTNSPFQLHTYRDAARLTSDIDNSNNNTTDNNRTDISSAPVSVK